KSRSHKNDLEWRDTSGCAPRPSTPCQSHRYRLCVSLCYLQCGEKPLLLRLPVSYLDWPIRVQRFDRGFRNRLRAQAIHQRRVSDLLAPERGDEGIQRQGKAGFELTISWQ